MPIRRQPWAEEEDAYLRRHYAGKTLPAMALALGRTQCSVQMRLRELYLRKPAEGREPAWRFQPIRAWERSLRTAVATRNDHARALV